MLLIWLMPSVNEYAGSICSDVKVDLGVWSLTSMGGVSSREIRLAGPLAIL